MLSEIWRHTGPVVLKLPLFPPLTAMGFAHGEVEPPLLELEEELELEDELEPLELEDELEPLELDDELELLELDDELELLELDDELDPPPTVTSNEFVASPTPPFQISKPASTSIRYQAF
jgi:hypothetical protein